MRRTTVWLVLAISIAVIGCAGQRGMPRLSPADCAPISLQPAPVWNGAAAWRPADDQLVLVDPQGSLLEFSLTGQFRRRVEPEGMASFDLSSPVRLEPSPEGYVLGGQGTVLWLTEDLAAHRRAQLFGDGPQALAAEGLVGDFVELGDELRAYADFRLADSEWQRGFVALDLQSPDLQIIEELALDQQAEWSGYYFYDVRPFMSSWRQRAYLLRLGEEPAVYRFDRQYLQRLGAAVGSATGSAAESDTELQARALYARREGLFVLLSRDLPAEEGEPRAEIAPRPIAEDAPNRAELLAAQQLTFAAPRREWWLHKMSPKNGRSLASFRLPSTSYLLTLLPGEDSWGLIEGTSNPNSAEDGSIVLRRFPARLLSAKDGGQHRLECAEPHTPTTDP